jgi:hypothetical protein
VRMRGACATAMAAQRACSRKPSESMGLTATLDDGVSCDGVHEADDDAGRQKAGGGSILMHDVAHAPFSRSLARQRVDCSSRVAVLPLASFSALRRVKAG